MSITLPTVDMSQAIVGTQGKISLQNAGLTSYPSSLNKAILHFYNESGFGLLISFSVSPNSDYVPARGAREYVLEPGESQLNYSVLFANPSTPVQLLIAVVYLPNEAVPDPPHSGTDLNPFNTNGLTTVIGGSCKSTSSAPPVSSATLVAVPNKTTYITGFDLSSEPTTTSFIVYRVQVADVLTGNMNFYKICTTTQTADLVRIFPFPIPATSQGQSILATLFFITGAANNVDVTLNVYGYNL